MDYECEFCGYRPKTEAERERHAAGLDQQRLACPAQDLDAIQARERVPSRVDFAKVPW
jgi:hypothetical protein